MTLHEKYELKISYEFLARDYNQEGELTLVIDPKYKTEEYPVFVDDISDLQEDEITFEDIKSSGPLF